MFRTFNKTKLDMYSPYCSSFTIEYLRHPLNDSINGMKRLLFLVSIHKVLAVVLYSSCSLENRVSLLIFRPPSQLFNFVSYPQQETAG